MTAPAVSVAKLSKAYGQVNVLRDIGFDVIEGSVTVIIGPSGSGKTTLLRSLNALELPDGGTITVGTETIDFAAGQPSRKQLARYRSQSAMVFQSHNLFPHKTVLENVTEGPIVVQKQPTVAAQTRAQEILARVGLADHRDKYPQQLSGGQQQRVGIARALAMQPKVVLFDEPTSALDPELVGGILTVMRDLATEGWTMVVVTHEIAFAREVADQVLFVDGGTVLEAGPPASVIGAPQQPRTREFLERILNPL